MNDMMLRIPTVTVHDILTLLDESHPLLAPGFPNIAILLQQSAKLRSLFHLRTSAWHMG